MNIKIKVYCQKGTYLIFGVDNTTGKHYTLINDQYWFEVDAINFEPQTIVLIDEIEIKLY